MSDKPKTVVYDIPGDLPALYALGLIRPARWTARMLRTLTRRLDYLDACIEYNVVPDAKGRKVSSKDGHKWRQTVPVPGDLDRSMGYLAEAVAACRALLDAGGITIEALVAGGDIAAADARMLGIDELVADMARRGTPASEKMRKWAAEGGETRRGKLKPDTLAILAYVKEGYSYRKTARTFGRTVEAVKKLVQRHGK